MNKAIKWIFGLSLTANIFFIGFFVGREAPPFAPPFDAINRSPVERLMNDYPMAQRDALRPRFQVLEEKRQSIMKQIKASRDEMVALLEAPVFDKQKFLEKIQILDEQITAEKRSGLDHMATLAEGMNQEDRKILARHFRHADRMMEDRRMQGRHRRLMIDRPEPPIDEKSDSRFPLDSDRPLTTD